MKQKFLSVLLCVCLFSTIFPCTASATCVRDDNVINEITSYIKNNPGIFKQYSSYRGKAWGCCALVNHVWRNVFGTDIYANPPTHTSANTDKPSSDVNGFLNANQAKSGDILWCHTADGSSITHYMIILDYDSTGIRLSDAKWDGSLWHNDVKINYNDKSYSQYFGGNCFLSLRKVNNTLWTQISKNPGKTLSASGISGQNQSTTLTEKSVSSGSWEITIPASYRLSLYNSSTSATTDAGHWIDGKSAAYKLVCTKKATLSNNTVRYYVALTDGQTQKTIYRWFEYTNSMSVKDQTQKAQTYTISFDANGGTVSKTSYTVTAGSTYGSLPTPERNGYIFQGWYTSRTGGNRITASSTVNLTTNQILYAVWKKNSEVRYAITFDGNGGSVSQTTVYVSLGSVYGSLPTPERNGYRFDGWFTGRIGGTLVSESSTVSFAGDQTLFAHWAKNGAPKEDKTCKNHEPGQFIYRDLKDSPHPHYNYYKCANCGELYTDGGTAYFADCPECNPPKEPSRTPWSEWNTAPVSASSTREVETREVKVSDERTEYRYGRYIDNTGRNDCWCETYLESLPHISGRTSLQYSEWTQTQYGTSGKKWTCGYCNGTHTGIDHVNPDGRPVWVEYLSPNGDSYYWVETRTIPATYETQYRYRDFISN